MMMWFQEDDDNVSYEVILADPIINNGISNCPSEVDHLEVNKTEYAPFLDFQESEMDVELISNYLITIGKGFRDKNNLDADISKVEGIIRRKRGRPLGSKNKHSPLEKKSFWKTSFPNCSDSINAAKDDN